MSWETALDNRIHDYLPDLKWVENEPMAKHTSFRIGGPARRMAFPKTREQLVVLMGFLQDAGVKPLLIGNGTNLLVSDEGLDTVVIDTSAELSRLDLTGDGISQRTRAYRSQHLPSLHGKTASRGLRLPTAFPERSAAAS